MLSQPRGIFGVHSVTPYSRVDGTPFGTFKTVKKSTFNFAGSTVPLTGGSNKSPWATEEGLINCGMDLQVGEFPDWLFQLFMGATPTENSADATGAVTALTNKKGTSIMNATTGIASVGVISGSEGDLKFTKYLVLAKTTTTVNVYGMSDIDFQRGTAGTYNDDSLALLAANVTITASTGTNITGFGFKLTGGSGTIGMTAGDTATFEVRPKNTANMSSVIGQSGGVFPEFGCLVYAKKRGTGEMFEIDAFRCKGEGFPLSFEEGKWAEAAIKVQCMYDSTLDGFAKLRQIVPVTAN